MKPSVAFYSTIGEVTELTSHIFSLGHRRYFANNIIVLVILYYLGEAAKVVIGFPLGLIIGVFVAGLTALINLFKWENQPARQLQNNNEPSVKIAIEPTIDIKEEVQPTIEMQLKLLSVDKITENAKAIQSRSFTEKKAKFIHCINLLKQCIDQKLINIQPFVHPYEQSRQNVENLKRQLDTQNHLAYSAQKFSHNVTKIDYKVSCPCGCTPGHGGIGLRCNYCKGPVVTREIRKIIPIYVADTNVKQEAQTQSQALTLRLKQEVNKYPQPPVKYEIKKQLMELNSQLRALLLRVETEENKSNLSFLLSQYKEILSKVESQFSTEDHFKKSDFIPTSDYAQYYVSVKMLQQLTRQNGLFKSIPEELQKQIALFTTSSTFSEKDAGHIFNNS